VAPPTGVFRVRTIPLVLVALASGCGPSAFQRGAFALRNVTGPATVLFSVEYDAPGDLCRAEERFSYLRAHVDATWKQSPPTLAHAYLVPSPTPDEKGRCDQVDHDREIFLNTLHVVARYGEAVGDLALTGAYNGDLGGMARALGQLTGAAGTSPMISGALSNAGDPLRIIADTVTRKLVERELRKRLAEHKFEKVFDLLDAYLKLSEQKRTELEQTVKGTLTLLARQAKMAPGESADAPAAIAWFAFAEKWNVRLKAIAHKQALYRRVLDDVKSAYAALVALSVGDERWREQQIADAVRDVDEQTKLLHDLIAQE